MDGGGVMESGSAQLLRLMSAYKVLDYSLSFLEVQKLAYFLQEAGEPLRLNYEADTYGPYANNLNKVLEVMEGHFIRGYGNSQKQDAEIELLPGAIEEASAFLADKQDSVARFEQVADLIEGFETPYGMELLATVHWVAHYGGRQGEAPAADVDATINVVHAWNPRKRHIFKPNHIRAAWMQLAHRGWMH